MSTWGGPLSYCTVFGVCGSVGQKRKRERSKGLLNKAPLLNPGPLKGVTRYVIWETSKRGEKSRSSRIRKVQCFPEVLLLRFSCFESLLWYPRKPLSRPRAGGSQKPAAPWLSVELHLIPPKKYHQHQKLRQAAHSMTHPKNNTKDSQCTKSHQHKWSTTSWNIYGQLPKRLNS